MAWMGEAALYFAFITGLWGLFDPKKKGLVPLTTGLLIISLGILIYAHSVCDFTFLNVVEHGHTDQPLLYKIAGVWGNHEGSMLLWVVELSLYYLAAWQFLPRPLARPINQIIGCVLVSFIVFILAACNPFMTLEVPPLQGEDLNPVLQDPSLSVHPPCLYAGYTGLVVPFALAVYALINKQLSPLVVQALRRWTVLAWTWLTLGLGLGSFWAYYELGWGGWWFWDPVETVSILPWLTATALLHTLSGYPQALKKSSLLLAILGFVFCLLVLFFVRSGIVTSIHSFAVDAERGLFLFSVLFLVMVGSLGIWFWYQRFFFSMGCPDFYSCLITIHASILGMAIGVVLLAILYPLVRQLGGKMVSIGTPYFQTTFVPLTFLLLCFMGIGPWISKSLKFNMLKDKLFHDLALAFTTTLGLTVGLLLWVDSLPVMGLLVLIASLWLILTHIFWMIRCGVTLKTMGMFMAHTGLGLAIVGMIGASYGQHQQTILLTPGQSMEIVQGWQLTLANFKTQPGPNYFAKQAVLEVHNQQGQKITTLTPERRYYTAARLIHTEVSFYSTFFSHLYVVLLEDAQPPYAVQVTYKPWINFLWLGIVFMVLGGGIASLRRFLVTPSYW